MQDNLDPACLRAFLTVAETGSFTVAARRLLRGQSAVSLQVQRLEEQVGLRLLDRSPRRVMLTPAGERLLEPARRLLALNDALLAEVRQPGLSGPVRLGVPEDFATTHLPGILAHFVRQHPRVSLEVTCELTLPLMDRFAAGAFDLVLVKHGDTAPIEGETILRERLVWAGAPTHTGALDPARTVALVCSPRPCVLREIATRALDAAGLDWRVAYSCGSLAGNLAAVRAGLGIAPLPLEMVPDDLAVLTDAGLPQLPEIATVLLSSPTLAPAAEELRDVLRGARLPSLRPR
ncbi:LysR family transcriptional regulator [Altererythrobacter lauratis]|uniref:LysR family transcriptional regulator n=1 Tax=Alteraurantiacibacter lauratis TaxID=2054627 RepID=A0ABV7EHL1_9SPHN